MANVNVTKIQMVYFFKKDSDFKSFYLTSLLYEAFKDIIKTDPQTFSVPTDAPKDVPRCTWEYKNKAIVFSEQRMDVYIDMPTNTNWYETASDFLKKTGTVLEAADIEIDRVGLITEGICNDNVSALLEEYIHINTFNTSSEKQLSWLEKDDLFNIWTNLYINKRNKETTFSFDVNSYPDVELSSAHLDFKNIMSDAIQKMKGMIKNVLQFNK